MAVLSSRKILQEKNTSDPDSVTSLTLTHKALSDVSCLSEFKNLERLDLSFNNLTTLEGLKSCVNLKWLSVVQNKLQSLKGIEGLTKLTVLNAGKNKLKSMDEVKYLPSLRALILNDNEISSVCKLDQLKELNTLVLSRNPISSLGESLVKLKSITKLSLSNCKLQTIDSSLKSCLELKELRLAHNEIMAVPSEFGHLVKLQNLDIGNNVITNWSSLKVLSSLVNLRNLNLQGNPIAEKENLLKKVKKLLPNLLIFNARPIDKIVGKEVHKKVDNFSVEAANKSGLRSETHVDHPMRNKNSSKAHPLIESVDNNLNNAGDLGSRKRKELLYPKGVDSAENIDVLEKRMKKKLKLQQNDSGMSNDSGIPNVNPEEAKKSKHNKQKTTQLAKEPDVKLDSGVTGKEHNKKTQKKIKGENVNIIDSAENPFTDLFEADAPEVPLGTADKKLDHRTDQDIDAMTALVTLPTKKKKKNRAVDPACIGLSEGDEIGLGGPSAWGD
ncbi:U2-associated snRNP A' protein [Handroanthus impetiginosus]|uniref:U2-associated snRNP A' protein n=1 Tax=Handroanthus impetiginosus TaxID=429701 RepID=A0A2G9FY15_9LAMI|nr:U2-associated snRNP A' protein [Handroanthus impetiginosus]